MKISLLILIILQIVFGQQKSVEELKIEIEEVQKKIQKEKEFFTNFQLKRQEILEAKRKEIGSLDKDSSQSKRDLNAIKARVSQLEIAIRNYKEEDLQILKKLREFAQEYKEKILKGVPFDIQRRASILTAIMADIDLEISSPVDILNRLINFLDEEDMYTYENQVYQTILEIGGQELNVSVLRLGLVIFYVDTGREVYSYIPDDNGKYFVDVDNPMGVEDRANIRDAIRMLNGQKSLDLISLPIKKELKK